MAADGITITNFNQVIKHMSKIDISHRSSLNKTRTALKKPFLLMKKKARDNLKAQGSMHTDSLYRGLSVGSRISKTKGYMTVAFGGRGSTKYEADGVTKSGKPKKKPAEGSVNHFHLVNSGTVRRQTKKGKNTGAVGKARTTMSNPSFKVGFADKAIKPVLPLIKGMYISDFNRIINSIRTQGV